MHYSKSIILSLIILAALSLATLAGLKPPLPKNHQQKNPKPLLPSLTDPLLNIPNECLLLAIHTKNQMGHGDIIVVFYGPSMQNLKGHAYFSITSKNYTILHDQLGSRIFYNQHLSQIIKSIYSQHTIHFYQIYDI
jgi:hypothetical protein